MISACTAAVQNPTGAILARFFLGAVELVLYPGALYYISRWYSRKEMQLRVTLMNAGNLAAQAFGGLIAAGVLGDMDGDRGILAWRWLFIIEGVLTIFLAMATLPVLPDYQSTTKWLTEKEKAIADKRLVDDAGISDDEDPDQSVFHGFKLAVMDPKVWLLALVYHAAIMGLSFR
jgi:MFS family permease